MKLRHILWVAVLAIVQTSCQDIHPEVGAPISKTEVFEIKSTTAFPSALNMIGFNLYKEKPLQISYITDLTLRNHTIEDYSNNVTGTDKEITYKINDFNGPMYYTVKQEASQDSMVMPNVDIMDYQINLSYTDAEQPAQAEGIIRITSYSDTLIHFPFERYLTDSDGGIIGVEYGTPDTLVNSELFSYTIDDMVIANDNEVFN
ncbi:hypothetical protein KMW28_27735 [Flammeovirga yaeyamensis]|uniref:LPS export ABC transporter periplasmic protein LptC n=1 Tax=Flammeovirga yaeyamensis TaxID=367791 RepID=A0AAX1NAV5_9BACT|nr:MULTISPECIES: hypothetical protein [Flammeovirga]ANQ52389.1 hypothetical protein MY04_5054 [Flammeovirga sp. MY04]MBB3699923.1 hypothetical protein [Flammeovirga yaeyamensis]NMF37638.1 hypothetical protein [Flammeovirga yaeyamensis]QWG04694.1 hypothetical protein KMW28_27735 [Flammeovirga yaeyamensis]